MKHYSMSDIFDEAYRREFSEFDNSPQHKFSFSHNRKMKRIFKIYSDNQTKQNPVTTRSLKRLSLAFILVIILLALAAVSAAAVTLYNGFIQKEYSDHTDLLAIDYENSIDTIEYIYEFTALSDDYEIISRDTDTVFVGLR